MDYTIKNLKTLSSGAYTCTLYENGKRVAVIEDDGRGGQPRIEPIKAEHWGKERDRLEKALTEWAGVTLPEWYLSDHGTYSPALDPNSWELAIGYLLEMFDMEKVAKRAAKDGKVIVLLAGGSQGITTPNWIPKIPQKVLAVWQDSTWVPWNVA